MDEVMSSMDEVMSKSMSVQVLLVFSGGYQDCDGEIPVAPRLAVGFVQQRQHLLDIASFSLAFRAKNDHHQRAKETYDDLIDPVMLWI